MSSVAIIPARLGSTRFPGKVLANDTGRPLIAHVCEQASRASLVSRVVVATDSLEVAGAVAPFGFEAVMTGEHPNGTSRLAEAARSLDLAPDQIIVNVQGDEPEIEPAAIDAAVEALAGSGADVGTVAAPGDERDGADPNVVKVVRRRDGRALLFSRAPIPHDRDAQGPAPPLCHAGIYAYRRSFLQRYVAMPEGDLERAERLEQLRVLEHGGEIAVAVVDSRRPGVDTPEQYAEFVERWHAKAEPGGA